MVADIQDDATSRSSPEEVGSQQRRVDNLMHQLSSGTLDMQQDLREIIAGYKDGLLSAEQIESMALEEKGRGQFLMTIALAMKSQLEGIFTNYADMADKVEQGEQVDSASISSMFVGINEAINTVRYIGQVVQAPTLKLNKTLPGVQKQLGSSASSMAAPLRGSVSESDLSSPSSPNNVSNAFKSSPQPSHPPSSATLASTAAAPVTLHAMDDEEEPRSEAAGAPGAAEAGGGEDDRSVGSVKSIRFSRVPLRADAEAQTEMGGDDIAALERPAIIVTVPDALETTESTLDSRIETLRIEGQKATKLDRKAAEKAQAALAAALVETQQQQAELAAQRAQLEARTLELVDMARRVTLYERATQGRIEALSEEVDRRVALVLNAGVTMTMRHPDAPPDDGDDEHSFVRPGRGGDGEEAELGGLGESTTTQSFLELGLEAALVAQVQTMASELGAGPGAGEGAGALHQELQNMASLYMRGDNMMGSAADSHANTPAGRAGTAGHRGMDRARSSHQSSSFNDPERQNIIEDDLSSVGGMSQVSAGSRRASSPNMGGSLGEPSLPPLLPFALDVPPPLAQHHGLRSQLDLVVIFPPSQGVKETDTSDFNEYLHGTGPYGPREAPGGKRRPKKSTSPIKVPASPAALANASLIELSLTGTAPSALLDDSEDEHSPGRQARRSAPREASRGVRLHSAHDEHDPTADLDNENDGDDGDGDDSAAGDEHSTGDGTSLMSVTRMDVYFSSSAANAARQPQGTAGGEIRLLEPTKRPSRAKSDKGLPIVSRSAMGLTTRTYKTLPVMDVVKELREAENPLLRLMEVYGEHLPDAHYALLAEAAAGSGLGRSMDSVERMFRAFTEPLSRIDAATHNCLKELHACEDLSSSLIVLAGSGEVSLDVYKRSLSQLFHQIGDVDAVRLWVEIQLVSFRATFERVNALKIGMLADLSQQSRSFKEALESFVSCQSRVVEVAHRLAAIKDRCVRYKIASPELWRSAEGGGSGGCGGAGSGLFSLGGPHSQLDAHGSGVSLHDVVEMEAEITRLRSELAEAQAETEEMNLEIFRVMQEGDRTPGALLFFAALHDPVTVSVMQQVVLQLSHLRAFSEGSAHLDFASLRKRLQVCISCMPSIDRFVQRYSALHKKWTANRLGLFTARGLTGGSGDASNLCPMCSNDAKVFAPRLPVTLKVRREAQMLAAIEEGESQRGLRRQKRMGKISDRVTSLLAAEAQADRNDHEKPRNGTAQSAMTDSSASPRLLGPRLHAQSLPSLDIGASKKRIHTLGTPK